METLTVDILNPKAKKVLEGLEEMALITIKRPWAGLADLRRRLEEQNVPPLTLEEITEEAEAVRAEMHATKQEVK